MWANMLATDFLSADSFPPILLLSAYGWTPARGRLRVAAYGWPPTDGRLRMTA